MAIHKTALPHVSNELFLTDGGLETTLVFIEGYELPCFAAFDLLKNEQGYRAIKDYYKRYLNIAKSFKTGFILESPTWRANPDWMAKIGFPPNALVDVNEQAVQLLFSLKNEVHNDVPHVLISGCIGPRGDGYIPSQIMTAEEAAQYHAGQIAVLSKTGVDMISAITMNYAAEAIGIVNAASAVGLPAVISFTVETDGTLPEGMGLQEAIAVVDNSTLEPPIYYMINCAHPTHFSKQLMQGKEQGWTSRIRGVRANASCKSHAELDEATELDRGNPHDLGNEYKKLKDLFPHLNVFGGCCGTDEEHILAIARQIAMTH
ncbi:homocysteine S-methyltransferase family protein [Pseudocnuella soli]|uniref:homocysteine S-methyltransferase family protein n=1 Tax=Pseudocnuella soli TaxID=2502779 RepID=UPI0010502367|nr:homocysteine S-methyltransferase family protein [Pseudocnuella soli]